MTKMPCAHGSPLQLLPRFPRFLDRLVTVNVPKSRALLAAARARAYLTKPLDVKKLLAFIDEILKEREWSMRK
jgi:hypothetical protein